jgi:hypothetical protein
MRRPRSLQLPQYEEAAPYIADTLMQIALQFEATHLAQIRRHYKSLRPEPDDNPGQQLDLFDKQPPERRMRVPTESTFRFRAPGCRGCQRRPSLGQ